MVRTNKILTAAMVAGLGMGFAASAHAQAPASKSVPTAKVEKPFRIKLGAFFPTDGDLKKFIGSTFFGYGLSYDFWKTNVANPITLGAYVDGAYTSKKHFGVNDRMTYTGVGGFGRYYFTPVTSAATRVYGGAGLGAYFINLRRTFDEGEAGFKTFSDNKTRFGGKLLAGVESGQGLFGELDYTVISKINDVNPSGINLAVGYRF